ncbi:MAG: hypothetical protein WAN46_07030 [Gammaproteobacteria bacterium]|jgi:hypothetical protein
MKTLFALGLLLIMVQVAVLIVLHRRRQRFRQEREKFLTELDGLEQQRTTSTGNE